MSTNPPDQTANEKTLSAKSLVLNILLLTIYAALVCFTASHHEPWCDEADPWLLARDENFFGIVARTGYIGSPALWYLMLVPLAKSSLPYFSMTAMNVAFAIVTATIVMFRSPFSIWLRTLICFSYLFVYEYSVIARSYGVSVLIIMSLAALHHRREKNPFVYALLIAILANTNVHGLIVAMAMTAAFVFVNWRKGFAVIAPYMIAAVGIGLAIFQVRPPADGQFPPTLAFDVWTHPVLNTFKGAFFPDPATSLNHGVTLPLLNAPISLALKLMAFAIIFLIVKKIWTNKYALLTFLFSYAGLFFLFAFKYYGSVRHWGFFTLVAIYCLWIQYESEKAGTTASGTTKKFDMVLIGSLLLSFAFSSVVGLYACATDIKQPFACGQEIATELMRCNSANDPVVCNPNVGLTILPYTPGLRVFYPNLNDFGTHAMWNRPEKVVLTTEELCEIIDKRFGKERKLYLLTDKETPDLLQHGFKFVYKNQQPSLTSTENLVLYSRN